MGILPSHISPLPLVGTIYAFLFFLKFAVKKK